MYTIYMHRNKINGKVYIGQTGLKNLKRRFKGGAGYKGSTYFYAAIQKYGWDSFEHIILETNIPEEKVDEKERHYIKLYKATDKEYGYNIKDGGRSKPIFSKEKSKKSKRVRCKENGLIFSSMTQAALFYGYAKESANNISNQIKGKRTYACKDENGTPLHWEFVDNPELNAEPKEPNIPAGSKPIKCLETEEVYYSIKEASRKTGISEPTLIKSCRSNGEIGVKGKGQKEKTHWVYFGQK